MGKQATMKWLSKEERPQRKDLRDKIISKPRIWNSAASPYQKWRRLVLPARPLQQGVFGQPVVTCLVCNSAEVFQVRQAADVREKVVFFERGQHDMLQADGGIDRCSHAVFRVLCRNRDDIALGQGHVLAEPDLEVWVAITPCEVSCLQALHPNL